MRRSSRILCFLLAAAALPAFATIAAQARGGGGRPAFAVGAGGLTVRAGSGGAGVRTGLRPGGGFAGPGRFGRRLGRGDGYGGYGFGDYGLDGVGLGNSLAGGFPPPPGGAYPGYGGAGPGFAPAFAPPPPPPCPMIIQIGSGLRRAVRTRVVYGTQPTCRR